jgi:two-component sensor histidine kinase
MAFSNTEKNNGMGFAVGYPVPDSLGLVYNIRKIIMVDINTCFVTTNRGLFKYDLNTHTINVASESNKSKLTEDLQYDLQNGFFDKGILWIASRNGLFSYNISTKLTTIYRGKGANSNYFFLDITHAANNQIVFAAGNGITIFNKQTKSFKAVNSIANLFNPACETVISINNTIWIGSEAGILNYNLNTHTSARAEQESAMMQIYPSSPFSIIGNDVVFGFRNGYSYFTPGVKNVIIPSDQVIEKVYVNNQPVLLPYPNQKNTKKLILRHSNNSINIAFTAFLYSEPDHINFRYRLMGADPKWQYTEDQRSANYAQLPPGEYTFYLQSGNKNGIWNKHLASFNFIITPPFWAAWWFRSLIILLVAFVLYLLYRYKIQHIKAIESLREGIASDFHDDLGSTLSSISIFSEVAIQKAESDLTAAKSMVGDIGMRARAMINSMNDMVWTIKPENDNLFKLMQRMEEFSYPVAEAKEIQLLFLIDQSLYDIKTDMLRRKNLFLIFKEAFNNAIKYSNSDKIEISFKLTHKKILMMQIIDNGCGFDFNTIKAGNGLLNMKKRTAEVKGKIKITTAIGTGTSINVSCKIA